MDKAAFLGRLGAITCKKGLSGDEKKAQILELCKEELNITSKSPSAPIMYLESELIGQCPENIDLQKGDVIKTAIGPSQHYCIIVSIDTDFNIAWAIPLTTDTTIEISLPIKNSRIFRNCYLPYLIPVFLSKNCYRFITVFDNKKELDSMIKIIKNYYKDMILK